MKCISLLTAAVSNSGAFIDAGEQPTIGDENDQISAARAAQLVEGGLAVEVEVVASPAPASKPRK